LIKTAELLADASNGRPMQSDLRRAVSTGYYALFHCLAACCADCVVGGANSQRNEDVWRKVYRSLEHRHAKDQCKNRVSMKNFASEIQNFAIVFAALQTKRHEADYDPAARFYKSAVKRDIGTAKSVIEDFQSASAKDRRAFAALVLLKQSRN
jgi:hypothetical protein